MKGVENGVLERRWDNWTRTAERNVAQNRMIFVWQSPKVKRGVGVTESKNVRTRKLLRGEGGIIHRGKRDSEDSG